MFLICSNCEVRVNAGSPGWLGSSGLRLLPAKTSIAIGQPSRATEQPIDDLPFAALAVAAVAELGERAAAAFPGSSNRVTGPSALHDPSWARPERANFREGGVRISTGRAGVREDPAGWRPKADYVKTVLCL